MTQKLSEKWAIDYAEAAHELPYANNEEVQESAIDFKYGVRKALEYVMERAFEESEVATFPPENGKIREDCCAGIKCRTLKSIISEVV